MASRRYFAVGTRPPVEPDDIARIVSRCIVEMLADRNADGTWGGPDNLDQLITTCHVLMTLMAAGIAPTSPTIRPGLDFLAGLNTSRSTTFYWRSGPLLNVPSYEHVIQHDVNHLARLMVRAGGNPNYPAPFFLLKLLRFYEGELPLSAKLSDVVEWVLSDWSSMDAWSGRTSITSMGLALLADLDIVDPAVCAQAAGFVSRRSAYQPDGRPGFDPNVVDDAFTVYNLYERWDVLHDRLPGELWLQVDECAKALVPALIQPQPVEPPFGGPVDNPNYAKSVVARALMARALAIAPDFDQQLAVALMGEQSDTIMRKIEGGRLLDPFWGPSQIRDDGYCFVLMPFSPDRRTEIYEDYIKKPLKDQLNVTCKRADDFYASRQIMADIWQALNGASFVIADMSGRNPNVFYELGLAHVLGKPVIMVVEDMNDIPFDLRPIRTIEYRDSPRSWRKLTDDVVRFAREILSTDA